LKVKETITLSKADVLHIVKHYLEAQDGSLNISGVAAKMVERGDQRDSWQEFDGLIVTSERNINVGIGKGN
jgi:hypothetical protein